MIREVTTGFFVSSKKHLFNFIWATGWFIAVYGTLLAYESILDDPFHISSSPEPDGGSNNHNSNNRHVAAGGGTHLISWWKETVSHIMIGGMKKASSSPSLSSSATPDLRQAIASQSLMIFRESTYRYRVSGSLPLDLNFLRRSFSPSSRPHYPILDSALNTFHGLFSSSDGKKKKGHGHAIALAGGKKHGGSGGDSSSSSSAMMTSTNYFLHNLADPRMPSQCGSFVFVDGSLFGSEASGAFAHLSNNLNDNNNYNRLTKSYLFESFVHCGRKTNTPSEISRRIEEYFRSCSPSASSSNVRHGENHQQLKDVTCVSPGALTLLLLKRRIMLTSSSSSSHHSNINNYNNENTRTLFFDIGAGSEIMSTIATSALHGYRQSERLERTRKYNNNNNGEHQPLCDPKSTKFTESVLAPPASVLPIEVASDSFYATEATKNTPIPSNSKLFASNGGLSMSFDRNHDTRNNNKTISTSSSFRSDCRGQDPDRVNISPMSFAIARRVYAEHESTNSDDNSVFVSIRGVEARNQMAITRSVSSIGDSHRRLTPRVYQCFIKQEEETNSVISPLDAVEALPISKNKGEDHKAKEHLKNELRKIDPDLDQRHDDENSNNNKNRKKNIHIPRLNRKQLAAESDRVFSRRLHPHIIVDGTNNAISQNEQTFQKKQQSIENSINHDEHDGEDPNAPRIAGRLISGKEFRKQLLEQKEKQAKEQQASSTLLKSDPSLSLQFVRTHPNSVSELLAQVESTVTRGYSEEEFTGKRADVTKASGVFFADVGNTDTKFLECGMALSQTEIVETMADSIESIRERKSTSSSDEDNSKNSRILREQLKNIESMEAIIILRPFSTRKKSLRHQNDKENNDVHWCSACELSSTKPTTKENPRQLYADDLISRTITALTRVGGVITSGCFAGQDDENVYFKQFISDDEKINSSPTVSTLRNFLYNSKRDPRFGAAPYCAVWMSSSTSSSSIKSNTDENNNNNNNNNNNEAAQYNLPTSEELNALRSPITDRLKDDREAGLEDVENVALETGLYETTKGEDSDDEVDEKDHLAKLHAASALTKKQKTQDPAMIALVVLAVLVAAYLIKGVCKNFGGAGKAPPPKQA